MIQQIANKFSTMHLRIYRQKMLSIIFWMNSYVSSDMEREEFKISLSIVPKSLRIFHM